MKKTKIFSLALLPVLIGLVVSCSGNGGGSESIAPEPSSSSRTASSATSTTSSKSSSEPEPEEFTVTFNVTKDAGWGNSVVMIGDFCEWEEEDALEMEWTAGNVWTTSMTFTEETTLEFKFALVDGESNFTYEADPNREVTLTEDDELDFEWQGDQPGPTPEVGYTMKINDGEAITLNKMDDEEGQPYVAQYCTDATLTKDGVVTFYQDGLLIEKIGPDADGEGFKNNIRKPVQEVNNFVIHNDYTPEEGDQSVYFKVWNDGGFSFSGMGYKEPVYTAKVNEDNLPLVKGEGLGGEVQYTAEGTQVEMGDIIKFFKDDVIDSEVELDNSVTAFTILEGVLTCVEAGKYNIYYQPEEGKIFVSEYSEAVITYKYYFEEYNLKFDSCK